MHVVVIRTSSPSLTDACREATTKSLLAQSFPDWSAIDGPGADLEPGLWSLPRNPARPVDSGEVLVFVVPDGSVLREDAFARIVTEAEETGARLVTTDFDIVDAGVIDDLNATGTPVLRFGWSPEALLSTDYTNGLFALRLDDYLAAAAAVPTDVPLCTWALLLHLPTDLTPTAHLAEPLARLSPPLEVPDLTAQAVIDAGLFARKVPAHSVRSAGQTRLAWAVTQWPTISLIIPTRHNEGLLGPLLESLAGTSGPTFDVVVVDNGDRTPASEQWYQRDWGFPVAVRWWTETPFHYGRVNNTAVETVEAEVVVLLNDDTRVLDPGWLAEMIGLLMMPGVGCVGSALLDATGHLQHAGVWLGIGGYAGHLFAGMSPMESTLFGSTSWYRNTLAVTAACLAVRRSDYLKLGGLDERMTLCGSDVTLGLDLVASGLRNVCTPLPGLSHLESATRSSAPIGDQLVSLVRYQPWHDSGDPYGNPRLSLRSNRPVLKPAKEVNPILAERARLGVRL
jgi:GT2 family glycosyltransferase